MKTDQANAAFFFDLSKAKPLARVAVVVSLVELPNEPAEMPKLSENTTLHARDASPTPAATRAEEHFEKVTVRHGPTRRRLQQMDVGAAIDRLDKASVKNGISDPIFTATEVASVLQPLNRRDVAQLVAEGLLVNQGAQAGYKIPFESMETFLERIEMAGLSGDESPARKAT